MSTFAEKLHKWSVQELNLVSEGHLIPDTESLRIITKGKYKRLWTYIINHVRSQSTVDKIKRILHSKKLLEEQEDNPVLFNDDSTEIVKLQAAISKAREKREYLMNSLSTVKERIITLEQKVQNTKEETFQINQKTALLELVRQSYDEKCVNLKDLFSEITSYKDSLKAYQCAKVCDQPIMALPYDFLYENKAVYDHNISRLKDLINISSSIFTNNFHQQCENSDILTESFKSNINELKKSGLLLTDLVILLKEISDSDLQQFTSVNMQSLSVEDFKLNKDKEMSSNVLLVKLKCDNVYNTLSSIKNKKIIEKLLDTKKNIFEDKMQNVETKLNDPDSEVKCILFEKLAENNALVASNNYLENYLEHISKKTQLVLKRIRQQKLCTEELSSIIQMFYNNADLTFFLMYTFSDIIREINDNLNKLQTFAQEELFESSFPRKEWVEELRSHLVSDRKLSWEYCDKTNAIQPFFSEPYVTNCLSSYDMQKSLNFKPFQNISTLCENWMQFKQKLQTEITSQFEVSVQNTDINTSELYSKIIKMLDVMKLSLEKAMLYVNDGMTCCHRNKYLIQEWWEQNAQYIPYVEHEGKTLKMWIDILSVLSDFEPQGYI